MPFVDYSFIQNSYDSYYEKVGDSISNIDDDIPFIIPHSWTWVRLGTCCQKEIKRGKSPKYVDHSGVLVFAQKCNTKYDGINMNLSLYLDETILSKYPIDEYMQDMDTVINSTGTGTLGRVGIYKRCDNPSDLPVVPDSHVTVIRTYQIINSEYMYYFLKAAQQKLEKMGEGSTNQKELKPITIQRILVPLPPIEEQNRICIRIDQYFHFLKEIENYLK